MTGIRSWSGATVSLALVVTMEQVRSRPSSGVRQIAPSACERHGVAVGAADEVGLLGLAVVEDGATRRSRRRG